MSAAGQVLLMTPALGLFYGGLVSSTAATSTMMLSVGTLAIVSVLWFMIAYSLAFAPSADSVGLIGDLSLAGLAFPDRVRDGTNVSEHAFSLFQAMFAAITPAVISGAVCGRMRYTAFLGFAAIWTIVVYSPLAHWVWEPSGWLAKLGLLDFAGGCVVETASGVSAYVLAYWLGETKGGEQRSDGDRKSAQPPPPPHNVPFVLLGAGMLWWGWLGFNGGAGLTTTGYGARIVLNTHTAASVATMAWGALEVALPLGKQPFTGRPTAVGAACGAIVGLVAITPACGYVAIYGGAAIAVAAATACFFASRNLNRLTGISDRLDVAAFHGVAGIVGTLSVGFFATKRADSPTDGLFYAPGGTGPRQLGVQVCGVVATIALCAVGTTVSYWLCVGIAVALGGSRESLHISGGELRADEDENFEAAYIGSVHGGSVHGAGASMLPLPLNSNEVVYVNADDSSAHGLRIGLENSRRGLTR